MESSNQFLGTERIGKLMQKYAIPSLRRSCRPISDDWHGNPNIDIRLFRKMKIYGFVICAMNVYHIC